jgi:N-acetylmuramoyl-L-alanine amidase
MYRKGMKKILIIILAAAVAAAGFYLYHRQNQVVVVIDPGHGGYDTGAIADDGTKEKDLALSLALKIGEKLEAENSNITVVYTRSSDSVSWPSNESEDLKERVAIAEEAGADYYLSIHLNSADDTSAYGYCAYVKDSDDASKKIASMIADNLDAAGWEYNRGTQTTENQSLYVVDQLSIPSMLFEAGFITNETELADLQDSDNQDTIAAAIAKAYSDYIEGQSS